MKFTCVAVGLLLFVSKSWAVPITFTHSSTGWGSLDGVPFANVAFTITGQGDTSNKTTVSAAESLPLDSAQIALTGIGTFTFTTALREFWTPVAGIYPYAGLPAVGLARASGRGYDLLEGPGTSLLSNWSFQSSIGPISGMGSITQWDANEPDVLTSGGRLMFVTMLQEVTYTATTVPEGHSSVLAVCAIGILVCRRDTRPAHFRK